VQKDAPLVLIYVNTIPIHDIEVDSRYYKPAVQ
jgi:hypothetical protein